MEHLIRTEPVYNTHKDISKTIVVTDTLQVSHYFFKGDKEAHKYILKKVRKFIDDDDNVLFSGGTFSPAKYKDDQGKPRPYYLLNRDQFTFLVMSFTGKRATKYKIAFINYFNEREEALIIQKKDRVDGKGPRKSLTDAIKIVIDDNKITNKKTQAKIYKMITAHTSEKVYGKFPHELRKEEKMVYSDETRNFLEQRRLKLIAKLESELAGVIMFLHGQGYSINKIFNHVVKYSKKFKERNKI